ncbi:MAG: DUF1552 domain-containing protein [Planctomycetales bacterium]|nr:DUF1552 domain-containing protein [Planctomycetales bacterium]
MPVPSVARRRFLQAAGVLLALPLLETNRCTAGDSRQRARRLVCVGTYLGFHQPAFFPASSGVDYPLSELLAPLASCRNDFSVFSGLDHRADNGHANWSTFLSGQRLGDVSLDQLVAEQVGQATRFDSVQLSAGKVSRPMSFARNGVALPEMERPSVFFKKLFAPPGDQRRMDQLLESGKSALDEVLEEARELQRSVSDTDRAKLSEYFDAVRDVERRVQKQRAGLAKPAPAVDYELPAFDPIAPTLMLECERIMYDLMALALQTDSTRVLTLNIGGHGQVFTLDGRTMRAGYHALSHHGNDPDKIRDLVRVELEHVRCLAGFLAKLKSMTDPDQRNLLDSTIVLLGTGMGDSSRHANRNLPTLVAGGGLKHGQHIAIQPERDGTLLGDLYISLMQQLGMDVEEFSNARSNMNQFLA